MTTNSYHEGELAVQERTGERNAAVLNGGMVVDAVPAPAVRFVEQQVMAALARTDGDGAVWSLLLPGQPGFARVEDDRRAVRLTFDGSSFANAAGPFAAFQAKDPLGLLFIEFATRRRLRVNGTVRDINGTTLRVAVEQAYPNCPKHIQRRTIEPRRPHLADEAVTHGDALTDDLRRWITGADTFLLATRHPSGAHDASHRGGNAGFVRVEGERLRIPDYPGNSMFMSFGNLALDPRAGLVFPDFASGRQLCLSGTAELDIDGPREAPASATGGTGRWWTFRPERWTVLPLAAVASGPPERSPFNPPMPGEHP